MWFDYVRLDIQQGVMTFDYGVVKNLSWFKDCIYSLNSCSLLVDLLSFSIVLPSFFGENSSFCSTDVQFCWAIEFQAVVREFKHPNMTGIKTIHLMCDNVLPKPSISSSGSLGTCRNQRQITCHRHELTWHRGCSLIITNGWGQWKTFCLELLGRARFRMVNGNVTHKFKIPNLCKSIGMAPFQVQHLEPKQNWTFLNRLLSIQKFLLCFSC